MTEQTRWQKIEATGGEILDTVKELVAEGNVRRIRIRQKDRTIAEFPLTIGVVGAVLAPVLAGIGAVTALLTDCTIDVEHTTPDEPAASGAPGTLDGPC
jgi:Domain of unknown function (DUF4342)